MALILNMTTHVFNSEKDILAKAIVSAIEYKAVVKFNFYVNQQQSKDAEEHALN